MESMSNGVTTQTLTEVVADHLRRLIHLGEVGPGDRLPAERELAEQLGIARLSLREALKTLQNDGYVEVRRGARGGTYVTELEAPVARWRARMRTVSGEFDDIIDFRIGLETETARLAAARRTPEDLAAMRTTIDDLTVAHDRTAFRLADSRFHASLARAARSSRLGAAVESTRAELFNTHDLLPFIDPVQESVDDHEVVFRAVEKGDVDAAAAAMRDHIEHTRTQLRAIVFATDPPSPDAPGATTVS